MFKRQFYSSRQIASIIKVEVKLNTMNYVIGIDGGGSKSILTIVDLEKNILLTNIGGPTNICSESLDNVKNELTKLVINSVEKCNLLLKDCISFCIGTAGADRSEEKRFLEDIVKSIGIRGNIIVTSDAEIVLAAETGKMEGIVLISGTGSIAYGINKKGEKFRVGGWGHLLGDEGSGYYIGVEAIKAALKSYDGREPFTELLPMIIQEMKLKKIEDIISLVYRTNFTKARIASLAKTVEEAYKKGDKKAREILLDASIQLFKLADAAIQRLQLTNTKTTLVVSGSILLKSDFVFESFSKLLAKKYPLISIKKLTKSPAWGAAVIALDLLKKDESL